MFNQQEKKRPLRATLCAVLSFISFVSLLAQLWLLSLGLLNEAAKWPAAAFFVLGVIWFLASFEEPAETKKQP